ncbi:hypothetical protein QWY75_00160 [Pontixanthobacter aestiaquae]|uniref:Uncharacterized protein n=1 Tax=Pontixanthobacter aestiaquae TaxID=1509367 RepID=A0A844ZAQ4_9SPHN|nr:hypothetical protein [Pontixanthobacter aestiaquae]MDN3644611.1 hypothetical protein [Pontixanthobacter aestiaquae]MXO84382.1 hypothetical protein [Pontixanthobacter aestiaquae]
MLDFRTVNLQLEVASTDTERRLEGGRFNGNFRSTGTLTGRTQVTFPSGVSRHEAAISAFHFETKNDHHLEKLKIEPFISVEDASRRTLNVTVEAAFKDDSPGDDFQNTPFIMSTKILLLVDRE